MENKKTSFKFVYCASCHEATKRAMTSLPTDTAAKTIPLVTPDRRHQLKLSIHSACLRFQASHFFVWRISRHCRSPRSMTNSARATDHNQSPNFTVPPSNQPCVSHRAYLSYHQCRRPNLWLISFFTSSHAPKVLKSSPAIIMTHLPPALDPSMN